jgi:hypothetical protein
VSVVRGSRRVVVLGALLVVTATATPHAADEGWRELARGDGVVVEARPAPGGVTTVRGTTVLEHSLEAIRRVLLDLERFPTWIRGLSAWTVLARGAADAVVYGRHDLPWPLSDRDYTVRYTWESGADRFVLEARSTTEAGPAPVPGVVRLDAVHSIWEVQTLASERCRVSYTYNGDLGGTVPRFVQEAGWKREARDLFQGLVAAIRRAGGTP